MKLAAAIILLGLGLAYAQEDGETSYEVDEEWGENEHAKAGAIVSLAYADIGDGSCYIELPEPVSLFHVMNGHIVPGEKTNPFEGRYQVAAPAGWEAVNGTLKVLMLFTAGAVNFTENPIGFSCDQADVADLSVYSFPQNDVISSTTTSNVHYRPGYTEGMVLTITLPRPVVRFNITGMDSRMTVDTDDDLTYVVSGFVNPVEITDMKEVHFEILYNTTLPVFGAGEITVSVTEEEVGNEGEDGEAAPVVV